MASLLGLQLKVPTCGAACASPFPALVPSGHCSHHCTFTEHFLSIRLGQVCAKLHRHIKHVARKQQGQPAGR